MARTSHRLRTWATGRRLETCATRGIRGQALLIAVLVLFAVATLAALFAAIITAQLVQTGRHADVVQLRNIAEAGLRFANEQLTFSADGADWRPPTDRVAPAWTLTPRPYRTGGGEVTVEVSFGPDPTRLQTRYIRVVVSAVLPPDSPSYNPFLRYTMLGLKPLLLTDYARFITDRYETNQPAALGVAAVEFGGGVRGSGNGGQYLFGIAGPIRSNTDLIWYGPSRVDLYTRDWTGWRDLGLLRDDLIEVAGQFVEGAGNVSGLPTFELLVDEQKRATDLFHPNAAEQDSYENGYPDSWRQVGIPTPNTWRVLANLPDYTVQGTPEPLRPRQLAPPRIRPPQVDAVQPDLQTNRYLALTRDSGVWDKNQAGAYYNTGAYGWGWTHFGGIYIDNFDDVQYQDSQGRHDLEKLRLNWVGSVGVHRDATRDPQGDTRQLGLIKPPTSPPVGPSDWWDKTARYYGPPGVEIILHGDDSKCPYLEIIRHDLRFTDSSANPDPTTGYYWRKPDGTPILGSGGYGSPQTAGMCSPNVVPVDARGVGAVYSDPIYLAERPPESRYSDVARFPFPPNGVIYAEGNVRIRGIMPPARGDAVTGNPPRTYFDRDAAGRYKPGMRRYDLSVVSGGTIYIEGDLLTLGPARLPLPHYPSDKASTVQTLQTDLTWGSRLALLARDYVCLNTTVLNPFPKDLFEAKVDPSGAVQRYNDAQDTYPLEEYPRYALVKGEDWRPVRWGNAGEPWIPTYPRDIFYTYHNPRLAADPTLRGGLLPTDLRLAQGHAGWYVPYSGGRNAGPPKAPDQPEASVRVSRFYYTPPSANPPAWQWDGAPDDYYKFVYYDTPPQTYESRVWFTLNHEVPESEREPECEFLPLTDHQSMSLNLSQESGTSYDFKFTPEVMPVPTRDANGRPIVPWLARPDDLGYLVGPLAIAPARYKDSGQKTPTDPLPVQIQALIYAQNGSWFIIPGPWFDEDKVPANQKYDTDYPGYHEPLNLRITIYGAVSENMPAPIGDVADWTSKWSGPFANPTGSLTYEYDPLLRAPRWQEESERHAGQTWTNRFQLPRFPALPMTPDFVIWGERVTGAAGG